MKHKKTLISLIAASLILGTAAILLAGVKEKETMPVEASRDNLTNGLFYRLKEGDTVSDGDEILIISNNGYAPTDFWGNPAYLSAERTGITLAKDMENTTEFALVAASPATLFTVEKQYGADTYNLRGNMLVAGQSFENDLYLGINIGDTRHSCMAGFNRIGYFYGYNSNYIGVDRLGACLESRSDNVTGFYEDQANTQWTFQYDEKAKGITVRSGLASGDDIDALRRHDLKYTPDYQDRFCRASRSPESESTAVVYKQIKNPKSYSITVTNYPKLNYNHGDKIDLSGLQITFSLEGAEDSYNFGSFSYNSNKSLFTVPEYATGSTDSETLPINFAGFSFSITINVSRQAKAAQIVEPKNDYRGRYMLVHQNEGRYYALDAGKIGTNNPPVTELEIYHDDPNWLVPKGDVNLQRDPHLHFEARIDAETGNYVFYNSWNVKYLDISIALFDDYKDYGYSEINFLTVDGRPRIVTGDNLGQPTNNYLCFNTNTGEYDIAFPPNDEGCIPVYLYRYDSIDEDITGPDGLNQYVAYFLKTTSTCDSTGQTMYISQSIWEDLRTRFNSLTVEAQRILVNTTYVHNQEQPGTVEEAMDRYDYIFNKYWQSYNYIDDFISRNLAGTMQNNFNRNHFSIITNDIFSGDTVVFIIIVTFSLSSLCFLIYLANRKKRKQ